MPPGAAPTGAMLYEELTNLDDLTALGREREILGLNVPDIAPELRFRTQDFVEGDRGRQSDLRAS